MNTNIKIYNNLFNNTDIEYFLFKIENEQFESITITSDYSNYYNRYPIPDFSKYTTHLENKLFDIYNQKYILQTKGAWINKIDANTNSNDIFHLDKSDLTIVTYLNDNFIGGEFEYIDDTGKGIKIKPEKSISLIMNNKLFHRVNPINVGERLSLICFFNIHIKTKKTTL